MVGLCLETLAFKYRKLFLFYIICSISTHKFPKISGLQQDRVNTGMTVLNIYNLKNILVSTVGHIKHKYQEETISLFPGSM